jgi:hypothetical protein
MNAAQVKQARETLQQQLTDAVKRFEDENAGFVVQSVYVHREGTTSRTQDVVVTLGVDL